MQRHDDMGFEGRLHIVLRGPDGEIKDERFAVNQIQDAGDKHVADQMSDQGDAAMSHMAVGTGTGQATSDTTLATENDRNALTSTTQGTGGADNDVVYVGTWAAGDATAALTEAGIFNDASAGDMLCYADFSAINKAAGDTLVITWTVTFGSS